MEDLEVVSTGIVVADCVARPVERAPALGRLEFVNSIGLHSGGSAATTGYALARFGVRSRVVARVGDDGFADFLLQEAKRFGAEPSFLRDARAGTSATLVTVNAAGERSFLHSIGANAFLTPQDLDLGALRARGAKILHVAGYFALPGMEGDAGAPTAAMFAQARGLGFTTSLDCVWDGAGRWRALIGRVLPETDVFCPSFSEACAIVGAESNATPPGVAQALFDLGVRQTVALKMGEAGAFVANRSGERHRIGVVSVPSVDGTGSGDAFIAGFLAARLRGLSLLACAKHGGAAGAMCVRAVGAMNGIGDWAELEKLAAQIPEVQA